MCSFSQIFVIAGGVHAVWIYMPLAPNSLRDLILHTPMQTHYTRL